MKKIIILAFVLMMVAVCLPSVVFAKEGATVNKVEFVGALLDGEEGESASNVENYYKIDGNKFVFTYSDGTVKEYILTKYFHEEYGSYTKGYFLDGDSSKEKLSVSPELKGEQFVAGDNEVRFLCTVDGNEYYTDYVIIKATPQITDLKLIMAEGTEPLESIEGMRVIAGNSFNQEGNQIIVTYKDNSQKTFICTKFRRYEDYYEEYVLDIGFFENGVVTQKVDGTYNVLYVDAEVPGDGFEAGDQEVRIRTYNGDQYVYSSETYPVHVYKELSTFTYEAPGELIGIRSGDDYDINFVQDGAKITVIYADGTTDVFKPAKVIGKNGPEVDFTLNGEENGKRIEWEWMPNEQIGTGGMHAVEFSITWAFMMTGIDVNVNFKLDGQASDDPGKDVPIVTAKAANPLKVKGKTVKLKAKTLKKKAQTIKRAKAIAFTKKGQGKLSYKLASVSKAKFKKYFKVSAKTGNITVKKGLKKGTYKVKVKVKAAGTANYKASAWKTVTVTVKVK